MGLFGGTHWERKRAALTEHDGDMNDEEYQVDKIEPTMPCWRSHGCAVWGLRDRLKEGRKEGRKEATVV